MRKMYFRIVVLLLGISSAVHAQIILTPKTVTWDEAQVNSSSPDVNEGKNDINESLNDNGNRQYILVKIDTKSLAGVNVQSARYDIHQAYLFNSAYGWFYFHALKSDWSESSVTWATMPQIEEKPFDSVWVSPYLSDQLGYWKTASHFTAQVRAWVESPATNYGFAIAPGKKTYGGLNLASDDYWKDSLKPRLVVNSNGASISGKVIDGKTKVGVPGIVINAYDENGFVLRGLDTSDANGEYRINVLLPSKYTIRVDGKTGYRVEKSFSVTIPENVQHIKDIIATADSRAVCGKVDGTWSSDSIFIVGNTEIASSANLTIQPGTVVLFDADYELKSSGKITAEGTASQPIIWTSSDTVSFKGRGLSVDYGKPSFVYNIFEHQQKQTGGALYISNVQAKVESCIFRKNSAEITGGGLKWTTSTYDIVVRNCTFYNNKISASNTIRRGGGGLSCDSYDKGKIFIINNLVYNNTGTNSKYNEDGGGGMRINGKDVTVVNNTVVNNFAGMGAGVFIDGTATLAAVYNNIVSNNRGSVNNDQITFQTKNITTQIKDVVRLQNNLIEKAQVSAIFDYTPQNVNLYSGNKNLSSYAEFVDSASRNFQLKGNSIAIGTGLINPLIESLTPTDMEGRNRLQNGKTDMGCFEYMGVLKNRLPIVDSIRPLRMFPNTKIAFTIPYTEVDVNDINTISLTANKPEVVITHTDGEPANRFYIETTGNWEGTATITATVKDTSNKVVMGVNQREFVLSSSSQLCGSYAQNVTLQGTVSFSCTVTIEEGATLTIKPGTKLLFTGTDSIIVKGRIIAQGTATDSILFDLKDTTGFAKGTRTWGCIKLMNPAENQSSSFAYCRFTHSQKGILMLNDVRNLSIDHCVFSETKIMAPIRSLNASYLLSNTTFTDISTENYPIVYAEDSKVTINSCRFTNDSTINSLVNSEGYESKIIINKSLFANNYSGNGAVESFIGILDVYNTIFENNTGANGAVTSTFNGKPRFFNCTFVKNKATKGGVVCMSYYGDVVMTNCILYGNTATEGNNVWGGVNGKIVFTNCLIQDGLKSMRLGVFDTLTYNKSNNIEVAPDFADYAKGDYSLNSTSPCRNKGIELTDTLLSYDYNGAHRQFEPDMGAIEYVLPNTKPESIALSETVYSKKTNGRAFAKIIATDNDPWDSLTITLTATLGVNANQYFALQHDSLVLVSVPNNSIDTSLVIELTATDYAGASIAKLFTITVNKPNTQPTNIALSTKQYNNAEFGQKFATITATCADVNEKATVTLTAVAIGNSNQYFAIQNEMLVLNFVPMQGTDTTLIAELIATNTQSETLIKQFTITVTRPNTKPNSISLSTTQYNNAEFGQKFATITATCADVNEKATVTLTAVAIGNSNQYFAIQDEMLVLNSVTMKGADTTLVVELIATNTQNETLTKRFTITVTNPIVPNTKPTNITLSSTQYNKTSFGQAFAAITATCVDANETATVALTTAGSGNSNQFFAIQDAMLVLNTVPMKGTDTTLTVELIATNSKNETLTKQFTISVHVQKNTDAGNTTADTKLKLWPVPASTQLWVQGMDNQCGENVHIISSNGNEIIVPVTTTNQLLELNVSALPTGNYIIRCGTSSATFVR